MTLYNLAPCKPPFVTYFTLGVHELPRRATAVLGAVAIAAALNYFLSNFTGDTAFNAGRVAIALMGGWFMVSAARRSL